MKRSTTASRTWANLRRTITVLNHGLAATVVFSVAVAANPAKAGTLMLRPAQQVKAGDQPLDLGDHAIPCVCDWNGDGKKDLMVGYRYADKIAVFLNVGTDVVPAFSTFSHIQAAGADIHQPGSGCGAPAPWVADYDSDGKRDLLVGNGADGRVYFYRNINTDAHPVLAAGVGLSTGNTALSVGSRATPYVHDWDGDGLNDLLVGNGEGYATLFRNVGSAPSPAYSSGVRLQAAGSNLNLGPRSVVRVFDWNDDGSKDLVGSSSTGVYWCENVGTDSQPVLAALSLISSPVSGTGAVPIYTGVRMRLDLADWNGDGLEDLVLGSADGTVVVYQGYQFVISSLIQASNGAWVLQWRSAPFMKYNILAGTMPEDVNNCLGPGVDSAGNVTSWTNASPGSAQFFRVQVAR